MSGLSKYQMQLSGINIPEEHNEYKELLFIFKFLFFEKLIIRENLITDFVKFQVFPYFYFYGTI